MPARTLVTLPHAHGVAAIVARGSGAALTPDVATGERTELRGYRPALQGLEDELTLTGGLLPPGAVSAVAFDHVGREHPATCGEGAWLALLDQPISGESPLVRFHGAAGRLVSVPPPAGVGLAAVDDAINPCPVCQALEWQKVTPAPPDRYGTDGGGRPAATRCGRCGHEELLGVLYAAAGPPSWPAAEDIADTGAEIAQREAEVRHAARQARLTDARDAPFRFYGLMTGSPEVAGLSYSDGVLASITLGYETDDGSVSVQTDTDRWLDSPSSLARRALEDLQPVEHWPDLSETAVLLWINARSRERIAESHRASVNEVSATIDGEPIIFTQASLGGAFAAAALLPQATIVGVRTGNRGPAGAAERRAGRVVIDR